MKGALIRISIVVAVAVVVLVVLRHLGLANNQRMMENMQTLKKIWLLKTDKMICKLVWTQLQVLELLKLKIH